MKVETKERPLVLIGVLAAVCVVAGLAVGFVYLATTDAIEAELESARRAALLVVHPEASPDGFELVETDYEAHGTRFTYYRVYDKPLEDEGRTLIGYACEGQAQGYSSTIVVTVGVGTHAKVITGIKITWHQETPGLGANCEQVASNKYLWTMFSKRDGAAPTEPWFQAQFRKRKVESLVPEGKSFRDVRVLSGATITTNAVVRATLDAIGQLERGSGWTPDAVSGGTKKRDDESRDDSDATESPPHDGPGEEAE
jgi:RnfABCDGE-type electron transport complex G subunit